MPAACRAVRGRAWLSLRAVVPCGSGEGRRHLRAGAVPGRVRTRCGLCADRHGLGHLRPHHGARSAGARRRTSSAWWPTAAPAVALSFEQRRPVPTNSSATFADGMACRDPVAEPIDIICRGAARIVRVTEDEIAAAMRAYYEDTHNRRRGGGRGAARRPDAGARANAGQARGTDPERRQYRPRGVRGGPGRANAALSCGMMVESQPKED